MRLETNTTFIPRMSLPAPVRGVTPTVSPDEKALTLFEGYAMNATGQEHRYQVVTVAASDALVGWYWDLGPSEGFRLHVENVEYPVPPYHQWAEWEHTVAELRFYADRDRDDEWAVKMLHEQVQGSDLLIRYANSVEEDVAIVKNRSFFGPTYSIQRGGLSRSALKERENGH
jgi:hypothetical protein